MRADMPAAAIDADDADAAAADFIFFADVFFLFFRHHFSLDAMRQCASCLRAIFAFVYTLMLPPPAIDAAMFAAAAMLLPLLLLILIAFYICC